MAIHGPSRGFFFQVLIKTITRISTDTAREKALKSVNLPSLKVKRPKRAYHRTTKSRNCTDVCMVGRPGGGGDLTCCPPKQKRLKHFPNLPSYRISALVFNRSISNLATLLILRRSFQPNYGFFLTGSHMKKLYTQLKNSQPIFISILSYSWVS